MVYCIASLSHLAARSLLLARCSSLIASDQLAVREASSEKREARSDVIALSWQRRLNRIHHVTLIHGRVDLGAVSADRLEIGMCVVAQDLVNLPEIERRVKAAGHAL